MALLVLGKTRCAICGEPIEAQYECVDLPQLEGLPPLSAPLAESSAHRRCLYGWAQVDLVRVAWRRWWAAGVRSGSQVVKQDGVRLLFRDVRMRYFNYIYCPRFIAVREASHDLPAFSAFLSTSLREHQGHVELTLGEYRVERRDERLEFSVFARPRRWEAGVGDAAGTIIAPKEVQRETFTAAEWSDFCDTE